LSPYELPNEIWSNGKNINFRRSRVNRAEGITNPFTLVDTLASPLHQITYDDQINKFVIYGTAADVYQTDGVTTNSIGSGYTATRTANWTADSFNGQIIFTNRIDHPQWRNPTSGLMEDLPNWAGAGDWGIASRCEMIKSFKNYLIALDNYDANGAHFPSMVRWSSPAILESIPPDWDPEALDKQAGAYELTDTPGRILDGITLGDYFVVYKEDAVWLMTWIPGDLEFVFQFRKLFSDQDGMLAKGCVVEFEGKHFVMSANGAYVHDGTQKSEVMEKWVADEFFQNVAQGTITETRVVADHPNKEIWVYYITEDSVSGWAEKALIWNWELEKWTKRDIPPTAHIRDGFIDLSPLGVDDWDTDTQAWDDDSSIWNTGLTHINKQETLIFGDPVNNLFYAPSTEGKIGAVSFTSSIERHGMDFGHDRMFKYVTRIIPHFIGTGVVQIDILAEDTQTNDETAPPVGETGQTSFFDIDNDFDVDCHVNGRYIGLRVSSDTEEAAWSLTGYTIEWEPAGEF
jgi:hypothetical protein